MVLYTSVTVSGGIMHFFLSCSIGIQVYPDGIVHLNDSCARRNLAVLFLSCPVANQVYHGGIVRLSDNCVRLNHTAYHALLVYRCTMMVLYASVTAAPRQNHAVHYALLIYRCTMKVLYASVTTAPRQLPAAM